VLRRWCGFVQRCEWHWQRIHSGRARYLSVRHSRCIFSQTTLFGLFTQARGTPGWQSVRLHEGVNHTISERCKRVDQSKGPGNSMHTGCQIALAIVQMVCPTYIGPLAYNILLDFNRRPGLMAFQIIYMYFQIAPMLSESINELASHSVRVALTSYLLQVRAKVLYV